MCPDFQNRNTFLTSRFLSVISPIEFPKKRRMDASASNIEGSHLNIIHMVLLWSLVHLLHSFLRLDKNISGNIVRVKRNIKCKKLRCDPSNKNLHPWLQLKQGLLLTNLEDSPKIIAQSTGTHRNPKECADFGIKTLTRDKSTK